MKRIQKTREKNCTLRHCDLFVNTKYAITNYLHRGFSTYPLEYVGYSILKPKKNPKNMIPTRLLISILKEENHALVRKLSTAEVAHWVERTPRMREIRVRYPMVTELRPRYINLYIVCDFHLLQSRHSTSLRSGRRIQNLLRTRRISNFEWIFNPPVSSHDRKTSKPEKRSTFTAQWIGAPSVRWFVTFHRPWWHLRRSENTRVCYKESSMFNVSVPLMRPAIGMTSDQLQVLFQTTELHNVPLIYTLLNV